MLNSQTKSQNLIFFFFTTFVNEQSDVLSVGGDVEQQGRTLTRPKTQTHSFFFGTRLRGNKQRRRAAGLKLLPEDVDDRCGRLKDG